MICINELTQEDIGKKVVYQSYEGAALEEGIVTSFNDTYIFVRYSTCSNGQATSPKDLTFIG